MREEANLQRILCRIVAEYNMDSLLTSFHHRGMWKDVRRTRELRDPSVCHDWLWALNRAHGACMRDDRFRVAVRLRIGANMLDDEINCARCDRAILDRKCLHALCCVQAESTRRQGVLARGPRGLSGHRVFTTRAGWGSVPSLGGG